MKSKLLATVVITAAGLVSMPAGVGLAAMTHPPHAERLNAASTVRHTQVRQASKVPPTVLAFLQAYQAANAAGSPGVAFNQSDGYSAVDQAFARFGPRVVACAHGVASRESGHWPYSDNGSRHGLFQLHNGFWGSILAAATTLQRDASWYDPYVNAWAASLAFGQAGTFHRNWPATAPGGC